MRFINLLHFYQPYNQQDDILDRIVHESYLPLLQGLKDRPKAKIVANISGVLLKLLKEKGYENVLNDFKYLLDKGQLELTGSAMYHAFLPLLPDDEIIRQIRLNDEVSRECFGDSYSPIGFFSPEMAVSDNVLRIAKEQGFKWIAAPQVAYGAGLPSANKLYEEKNTNLAVFFRNKRVSSLVLSAVAHSAKKLLEETKDLQEDTDYWFTVMDAETFGHHRVGHDKFFFELLDSPQLESVTVSDLLSMNFEKAEVVLRPSTWTNQEQDFWLDKNQTKSTLARSFVLWKDPKNPIHKTQWEFVDFAIKTVDSCKKNKHYDAAREKLDIALASDQFWWASTSPWWSLEMVEQGAFMLKDVILTLDLGKEVENRAESFYRKILDLAFEWQRSGHIRKKHLENSSTFKKKPFSKRTPPEWYDQIVLEFEDQMEKSAQNKDFEAAIKWRDALLKLRQGTDIHDVVHVVDELWSARKIPELKPFLQHTWDEISGFAKENFRDREGDFSLDKEEFENWKNSPNNAKTP